MRSPNLDRKLIKAVPARKAAGEEFLLAFASLCVGAFVVVKYREQALLWLGGFLIILGVWGTVSRLINIQKAKKLDAQGVSTQAEVVDSWAVSSMYSTTVMYFIASRFKAPSAEGTTQAFYVSSEITQFKSSRLKVGDEIQVCYLPDNPKICRYVF